MSRSCVCGGSNENCRFCGGLGTVPDHLGNALADSLQRVASAQRPAGTSRVRARLVSHRIRPSQAASRTKKAARLRTTRTPHHPPANLIPCPEVCGAFLNPRNVSRHLQKVHAATFVAQQKTESASPIQTSSKTTQLKYQTCSICNATVRTDRIEKHMAKAHRRHPSPLARPKRIEIVSKSHVAEASPIRLNSKVVSRTHGSIRPPLPPTKFGMPKSSFMICPTCGVKVKANHFQKHLRKVHRRRGVVPSAKDAMRQSTTLVAPRDKNLDATKLYAHPCREQGRYGSHPSHDGFDDESSPD
jgi:hypothetical protein